MKSGFFKAL